MYDIWNPTHGCAEASPGCANCYARTLDKRYGRDFTECKILKSNFNLPLRKDRQGNYKIPSGFVLRVCMNSDFFYEGNDPYRDQCWEIMRQRPDITFYLLTKRPERVMSTLPSWWEAKDFTHVMMNATCENQEMADKRIPILKTLPFKRIGIMCAPLLSDIDIEKYLAEGWIENVNCGGENYDGARPCYYEWAKHLSDQCRKYDVKFTFIETGTNFYREGAAVKFENSKTRQAKLARQLKLNVKEDVMLGTYQPIWGPDCATCGSHPICQGVDAPGHTC